MREEVVPRINAKKLICIWVYGRLFKKDSPYELGEPVIVFAFC